MKWSIHIGSPFRIPVRVHLTFFLLLAWYGGRIWMETHRSDAVVQGLAFILTLFLCVVLHEFGHALTARRYGVPTRDITLLPIGGVARLERMPDDPRQELWVALAGPAVNVVIAGVLYVLLGFPPLSAVLDSVAGGGGSFLTGVMAVNIFLVVFNLLPAFPMDGGRVLRALLATRMEYARATRLAATIGQAMALLFGFAGLFYNPILIFIALFVWVGAAQEANMVQMRHSLSGITVSHAMVTNFASLSTSHTLADAIDLTLNGTQRDFPVLQDGTVVGILMQKDMLTVLARRGADVPVSEVMQRDFDNAEPAEMIETAFRRLSARRATTAPVTRDGQLVGILTLENVGELLAIQGALDRTPRTG
jgi:Zn-dependent protease/predicted transcriptional regulator